MAITSFASKLFVLRARSGDSDWMVVGGQRMVEIPGSATPCPRHANHS